MLEKNKPKDSKVVASGGGGWHGETGKDRIIKGCEGLMEVTDLVTIWIVVMKSLVV